MQEHPIYTVLTRPKLIKGVPRDYAALSAVVLGIAWDALTHAMNVLYAYGCVALVFVVLFVVGWLVGQIDPELITVYFLKRVKIKPTVGHQGKYYGNRYEP